MIFRIYTSLLRLYPRPFHTEFGDEMEVVFRQAASENKSRTLRFLLREFRDFPGSLLRQYWYAITKEYIHMINPEYKRNYRIAVMVLLVIALIGPWVFERLSVPAEWDCGPSNIRLDSDFCGTPFSGIQIIPFVGGGIIQIGVGLIKGDVLLSVRELMVGLLLLLTFLPVISTLLMVLRGDRPRLQIFTIISWGFALFGGLFLALNHHQALWKSWGLLLYIALSIVALITEILFLASGKRRILT